MGRSFNQSSCGRGQLKASAVNFASSHWSGETRCRPPPGLACHSSRNALGRTETPRRTASLSQLSLQKPGPTIKQAVLTPCPASCQRENCSLRGQIVYEERQSVASGDQMESESSSSRCRAGLGEDELALLQFASFKVGVSQLCTCLRSQSGLGL